MKKIISIDGVRYEITDEDDRRDLEEDLIFEIADRNRYFYAIGLWENFLGKPVRKIWKIVGVLQ